MREGGFELPLYRLPPRFSCVASRNISQNTYEIEGKKDAQNILAELLMSPDRLFSLTWSAVRQIFFRTKESCYVKKDFNPLRIF